MTRGRIDLGTHKLAGLYRAPAKREPWKRARREKTLDAQYRLVWSLVRGAVRDTFASHPEYLTEAGRRAAERSICKRVTGTIHGYATQVARGGSIGAPDAARDLAANRPLSLSSGESGKGWLPKAIRCARAVTRALARISGAGQKFDGGKQ